MRSSRAFSLVETPNSAIEQALEAIEEIIVSIEESVAHCEFDRAVDYILKG